MQEVATTEGLQARQSTVEMHDVARMGLRSQGRLGNNEGELLGGQSVGSESPARDNIARRRGAWQAPPSSTPKWQLDERTVAGGL